MHKRYVQLNRAFGLSNSERINNPIWICYKTNDGFYLIDKVAAKDVEWYMNNCEDFSIWSRRWRVKYKKYMRLKGGSEE